MISPEAANKDQRLWQSVVLRAVEDAISTSVNTTTIHERDNARNWLSRASADFHEVCANAGLDPDHIRREAKKCIAEADARLPRAEAANRKSKPGTSNVRGSKPTLFVEHHGLNLSLREWSVRLGVPYPTLVHRRNRGLSPEQILCPSRGSRKTNTGGYQATSADRLGDRPPRETQDRT